MKKEKLYEYKTMKSNGAKHHFIKLHGEENWKLHNWDGPAIEPVEPDSPLKIEYYLHGIKYHKDDYDQVLRNREGLPYYKQPGFNGRN